MYRQAKFDDKLIFERTGESDFCLITKDKGEGLVPDGMARKRLCLPSIPEREVVKHYTNLSQMNFGVDNGMYPLGSCTMKYNPKYADLLSSMRSVGSVHPYQDAETVQGSLRLMYELEEALCAISDMDAVTLQPAAGAQGEFTGMLIARAYHRKNGEERDEVIVPDAAHGTNPASAAMAGFKVIEVPSDKDGFVDLDALRAALSERTAAFMITNPNTLGLFEPRIEEIAKMVHGAGALLYYDGANFNAILGHTSPGKMNFDIVHFNLHKTFATPHGGGGPGAGPVGVVGRLEPFLPVPRIVRKGDLYDLDYDRVDSIGKVRAFHGNFAVLIRAYAYILRNGSDGLREVSQRAVLNSNYLRRRLRDDFEIPYGELKKHEFVLSAKRLAEQKGVRALDVAKRLLDRGFMSPTIYFPMLVDEAMMIEPTETESKETLDEFANAMIAISNEDPGEVLSSPRSTAVGRIDELFAAKELVLTWRIYQRKKDRF